MPHGSAFASVLPGVAAISEAMAHAHEHERPPDPESSTRTSGTLYELVAQHTLPNFDPDINIKRLVFTTSQAKRYNRFMHRHRLFTTLSFNFGAVLALLILILPPCTGRKLAILVPVLELLAIVSILMQARIGVWRVVARTYDFWLFSATNLCFAVCFVVLLGDRRVLVLLIRVVMQQGAIMIDTAVTTSKHVAVGGLLNTVLLIVEAVMILFGYVSESQRVVLFRYSRRKHAISTRDLLLNSIVTLAVVLALMSYRHVKAQRKEYVKRKSVKEGKTDGPRPPSKTTNACVLYRCQVRLQEVNSSGTIPVETMERQTSRIANQNGGGRRIQMRLRQTGKVYDSADTLLSLITCGVFRSRCGFSGRVAYTVGLVMLYAIGCTGFILTGLCGLAFSRYVNLHALEEPIYSTLALILSCLFCGTMVLLYQRQLLWRLCTSFDVVFTSFQLTSVQLCSGDFFNWDIRHILGWSAWVWMHWVLTLDALPPNTRRLLKFKLVFATPVVVTYLAVHLLVGLELFVCARWDVPDRVVLQATVRGQTRQLHLIPFFLSRSLTLLMSCCRTLWRFSRRACEEDCIVLAGVVEYDYEPLPSSHTQKRATGSIARAATAQNSSGLLGRQEASGASGVVGRSSSSIQPLLHPQPVTRTCN